MVTDIIYAERRYFRGALYGSRVNTFGALHNTDERFGWFGPRAWRTTGDSFSYEYQLKRTGILAAPVIYRV